MIDRTPECGEPVGVRGKTRRADYAVLGTVCALVLGVYAWSAKSGWLESWDSKADDTYYNLLVQGFRNGQLNLKREVPSGLAQLADPYDPKANSPYVSARHMLLDLSYYKGKLYLYFGVTPALVLFWPYYALTSHYLFHKDAVVIFCSVGFLASAGLLWAVWRRYFAEVGVGVVAGSTLALGLATGTLLLLARSDVHEVAISCGYALTLLTLVMIWKASHDSRRRGWWLAGASLAYGLAVGARPLLVFGAVILLMPAAMIWRARAQPGHPGSLLLAATVPIMLIVLGLMLYNFLRFDDPFEFGWRYQLSWEKQDTIQRFSLRYLWFNLRVYFLEPARWRDYFSFVHDSTPRPLPAGHAMVENPFFGILTNVPLVWLALAMPLVWRGRLGESCSALRWFGVTLVLLFGICMLTLGLFFAAAIRYEVEFLPALVLLVALGILGLERALATRPVWRRATRGGGGLLLAFSMSSCLLGIFDKYIETYWIRGMVFVEKGQVEEAMVQFQKALRLQPDNALAHKGLGMTLLRKGKVTEAVWHLEQAVRLKPEDAETHNNLGVCLFEMGRVPEAMGHLEQSLRLMPNYTKAHFNLGVILLRQGKSVEAIGQFEQVLRLLPEHEGARDSLAWVLATCGDGAVRDGARAVELAEGANRLAGGKDPRILNTLAAAYAEAGRFSDAMVTAKQARDLAIATGRKELADQTEGRLKLYQAGRPYHEGTNPGH